MAADSSATAHYRERADAYMRTIALVDDRGLLGSEWPLHRPSVALLAVHAGISFCDAILVAAGGGRSTAADHAEAATRLEQCCNDRRRSADGVKHFTWLVGRKDRFAYGDRRVPDSDVQLAVVKAQRFATWAYTTFPELRPEHVDDTGTTA